ncbi:hypothetical protein DACRYDRAFT_22555 [Dacryopinax primogenitus]|uniref:MICOS complex subunit MIC12 n=1 Tax=Dacryopinax primogenitus (strain DJM 731) TaxID=1858805 RepID=M5G6F5_DACPD|nr:uncharacterized protein DACRYDRAFT_22555 [Dacryopinax primogenitus]EJU01407.1 hypothetical protein DACRYDRAFT_22555 [Dacryopinax primogenitus]
MSLWVVGTLAGALTGGVMYQAFSSSIRTRANNVSNALHGCSVAMADPLPPGPVPASQRIEERPFTELLKRKWNEEIESAWVAALHYDYAGLWSRTKGYSRELIERAKSSSSSASSS